jgi:prevent-host-death family protein
MEISLTAAKAQLTELVRRAEAGDDVVLTRHGNPAVRLVPIKKKLTPDERRAIIDRIVASANPTPGPSAARSQDYLYDENGLPK